MPLPSGYVALAGRIALLGLERVVVKQLGHRRGSAEATLWFFGLGALSLLPFAGQVLDEPSRLWPLLPAGFAYAAGFVLYVRALSAGEVSLVAPLTSFNVVFLVLLAAPFAGEVPDARRAAGLLAVFAGTATLEGTTDLRRRWRSLWRHPGAVEMLLAMLLVAGGRVLDKRISPDLPPLGYAWAMYTVVSLVLAAVVLARGRVPSAVALLRERPVAAVTSGLINAYAYVLLLVAMRTLDVSVAEPASNLSVLVAVALGGWLYGEPAARRLPAAALVTAGAWLLLTP